MNRNVATGTALAVLAAFLFGTLSYVSRQAAGLDLGTVNFVIWRAGLAASVLIVATTVLTLTRRLPPLSVAALPARGRLALAGACIANTVLNIAVFEAFQRTTVALALVTFYTFPVLVTLAAVRLYGERLDRRRALALTLAMAGLGLVVLAPVLESGQLAIDPLGLGLAFVAALAQAAFVLLGARGYQPLPSLHVATYVVSVATIIYVLIAAVTGELLTVDRPLDEPRLWVWVIAAGLTGAAIPTTAFLAAMPRIGPTRTAILMTLEPVVGVAIAAALLGERPVPLQLVGGLGVLVAGAVLQAAPGVVPPDIPERE